MALIIFNRKFLQKVFWLDDLLCMIFQMLEISVQLCLLVLCKHTKYYVWILQYLMHHASSSPPVLSFSSALASFAQCFSVKGKPIKNVFIVCSRLSYLISSALLILCALLTPSSCGHFFSFSFLFPPLNCKYD